MRRGLRVLLLTAAALMMGAGPAGAAPDTTKPRVTFTTADDAVLVGVPVSHEMTEIRGKARDLRGSGIRRVRVVWCGNAQRMRDGWTCAGTGPVVRDQVAARHAALTCTNHTRRRCSWSVAAPTTPGRYVVAVEAIDRAGNVGTARIIFVTVI